MATEEECKGNIFFENAIEIEWNISALVIGGLDDNCF